MVPTYANLANLEDLDGVNIACVRLTGSQGFYPPVFPSLLHPRSSWRTWRCFERRHLGSQRETVSGNKLAERGGSRRPSGSVDSYPLLQVPGFFSGGSHKQYLFPLLQVPSFSFFRVGCRPSTRKGGVFTVENRSVFPRIPTEKSGYFE